MFNFKQFCETLKKYESNLYDYDTNLPVGKEIGYEMSYLSKEHVCFGARFAFLDKKLAYKIYMIFSKEDWVRNGLRSIKKVNALYLTR